MGAEQAADVLAQTALFGELPREMLLEIASTAGTRSYKKGTPLFNEGDPGDSVLVLVEGSVKVFVSSGSGEEMVLATLRPPDTLGELALLDGGLRSAAVEALESTTVLAVARSTLLETIDRTPGLAEPLLRSAGALIRRLTTQAADLVFLDLEGRVAKLLVGMAEQRGQEVDGALVLDLGITQGDLAAMVGGSRQSVNHMLHALAGRGFLRVEGRRIVVTDPEALHRRGGQ